MNEVSSSILHRVSTSYMTVHILVHAIQPRVMGNLEK